MAKIGISSTAIELVSSLPEILGLDSNTELLFLRYARLPGICERAKSASDTRNRVAEMLRQSDIPESQIFTIRASDVTQERLLSEIVAADGAGRSLAICSCCEQGSILHHIPMMDFRFEANNEGLRILAQGMRNINLSGFILASGRSYHFYGSQLLNESRWFTFLGQSLLLENVADWRYVGHCLIRRMCTLRISRNPEDLVPPTVVALT